MAHDIRIPLTTTSFLIDQYAKLVPGEQQQQESFQIVNSNTKITIGRLNDLMNFYFLKSHQNIKLNIEQFNLSDQIQEIEDVFKIIAKMKNIQFSVKILCDQADLIINSDKQKIFQILSNLITNSLKFTPNGEILVQISLENKNILSYKVCDKGCGFSEDIKLKIKSESFDLGILTNDTKEGIGLGLYISRQILPYLGPCKNFEIKSKVGKGSTFKFDIYVDASLKNDQNESLYQNLEMQFNEDSKKKIYTINTLNCDELNSEESYKSFLETEIHQTLTHIFQPKSNQLQLNKNIQNKDPFNYQILIVDDQPFNIYVLKMQLLKMYENYQICEAFDGQQAIKLFEQFNHTNSCNQLKLIFMDCQMPIMNGFDATRYIKQKYQNENYIPVNIIGYTSLLTPSEETKCEICGMNFWLQKPATFQQIRSVIQKYYKEISN